MLAATVHLLWWQMAKELRREGLNKPPTEGLQINHWTHTYRQRLAAHTMFRIICHQLTAATQCLNLQAQFGGGNTNTFLVVLGSSPA